MAEMNDPANLPSFDRLHELFSYDPGTGLVIRKVSTGGRFGRAGDVLSSKTGAGYLKVIVRPHRYLVHRLAWALHYGEWPTLFIDHINRVKTDNRIENLRLVTPKENNQNVGIGPRNTSGALGVGWKKSRNKWVAYIRLDNKHKELGVFSDFDAAVAARLKAEQDHYPLSPRVQSFGAISPQTQTAPSRTAVVGAHGA
jgi:hypothetical protein